MLNDNLTDLDNLELLLNRPYGNLSKSSFSPIKRKVILNTIEQVESRLCLVDAMNEVSWMKSPKMSRVIEREAQQRPQATEITLSQSILILDALIVKQLSLPKELSKEFPFMDILEKIIELKAHIIIDPSQKMATRAVLDGIRNGGARFPNVTVIPTTASGMAFWYKTYALYKVIVPVLTFPERLSSRIFFNKEWLGDDEALNVVLSAYGVFANLSPEKMKPLIVEMELQSRTLPSLRSVMYAVRHAMV